MSKHIIAEADRLIGIAKLHKLSTEQMANRIGVTRQTYRRALAGEPISAAFIAGVSLAFGIPFDSVFSVQESQNAA